MFAVRIFRHFGLVAVVCGLIFVRQAMADYQSAAAAAEAGNFAAALKEWRPMAEKGDPDAQYALGRVYHLGEGVQRSDVEAVRWYTRAAEQGHAFAQADLGYLYEKGLGTAKDGAEAVKWYEKAAAQGVAPAQFNLALLYLDGKLINANAKKAAALFQQAAQHGYTRAQNQLGQMYLQGLGVQRDYVWAYIWLSLSVAGTVDPRRRGILWDLKMQAEKNLKPDELKAANEMLVACVTKSKDVCATEIDKR